MSRVWSWWAVCVVGVIGLSGCEFGLWEESSPSQPCLGVPDYCEDGAVVSCAIEATGEKYWSREECRGGVCRELDGGPMCVVDRRCDGDAMCVGNDLHQCVYGYPLLEGLPCQTSTCQSFPEITREGQSTGRTITTCAIDTTPCKRGEIEECRGNQVVRCSYRYPVQTIDSCTEAERCFEDDIGAKCVAAEP